MLRQRLAGLDPTQRQPRRAVVARQRQARATDVTGKAELESDRRSLPTSRQAWRQPFTWSLMFLLTVLHEMSGSLPVH
jgi:hypothetical protein